ASARAPPVRLSFRPPVARASTLQQSPFQFRPSQSLLSRITPRADAGICLPRAVYHCRSSIREPTQDARLRDQSDSKRHQRKNPHQTFRQPPGAEEPRDTAATENDRNGEQQLITIEKPDSTPPQSRGEPASTPEIQT